MSLLRKVGFVCAFAGLVGAGTSRRACAQSIVDFSYSGFGSTNGLQLVGNATTVGSALSLTQSVAFQQGAAWYTLPQSVGGGFDTTFQFQITNRNSLFGLPPGGDGFAFVIQNVGTNAIGGNGYYLGYGGLPCIAVEFDTWQNSNLGDPNNNHIGIHTNGDPSSQSALGDNSHLPALMGDGRVHTVHIVYAPGNPGAMTVALDGHSILNVPVDVQSYLDLPSGQAWVGLTGGTGAAFQNQDILSWTFKTPILQIGNVSTLVDVTGTGAATISWTTNLPADSTLDVGTSPTSLSPVRYSGTMSINHQINLAGLQQNTLYYYRVRSRDSNGDKAASAVGHFFTAVSPLLVASVSNITQESDGSYTVDLNVENDGSFIATLPTLTGATLGATSASGLPVDINPSLVPGQSVDITLSFPASAGTPGSTVRLALSGTIGSSATNNLSNFSQSFRVTLP